MLKSPFLPRLFSMILVILNEKVFYHKSLRFHLALSDQVKQLLC